MHRIGADAARSSISVGAAEVPGLRIGASVVLRAINPSADGKWLVAVNGARLAASVSIPLTPGARYSARVERLPERPGLLFRILGLASESRSADFLTAQGYTGDPIAFMALRALMSESLPLDQRNLSRLRAALSGRPPSEERAAALARALAKGMDPEAFSDFLESAGAVSGSSSGRGDGGSGSWKRGPDGRREDSAEGGAPSMEGGERGTVAKENTDTKGRPEGGAPSPGPLWKEYPCPGGSREAEIKALAGLLKHMAARTGGEPNAYQLFNARSGSRGRWIYAPYRFEREGVAFSGTLRILIPDGSRKADIFAGDVRVEDSRGPGRGYVFALRRAAGGYRLFLAPRESEGVEALARESTRLRRTLSRLGCFVEIGQNSDGFDDTDSRYEPVDDHA